MAGDVQGVPAGLMEEPIAGSQPQAASAVQGVPAGLQEEPVNSVANPHDFVGGGEGTTQPQESANPLKIITGAGKEALKTGVGLVDMANKVPGSPTRMIPQDLLDKGKQLSETHGLMEGAGGLLEQGGEWAAGEEGLKALTSLAKVAHYAPEVMKIIEEYPTASKTILGMVKGATIGGAQGAVKAEGEGKSAKEGAESGAEGGALGTVLAELGVSGAKKAGEAVGIGRDSLGEATRAGKPGKWNTRWEEDWNRALPHLADRFKDIKGKGVEGVADAALDASNDVWNNDVKPMIQAHVGDTKDVQPVADAVRARITPSLTKLNPERAKAMEAFSNLYSGSKSMMSIGEMENDIEHLNADLASSGWWNKSASEREAAIKSGQEDGMKSTAADELRNQVYDHIESFKGPNGEPSPIRELKKTYGSLRNVEHEFRGQVNVQNRQSTISLKKILGMTAGAAAKGPLGAVAAAAPAFIDSSINSPNAMAERAVKEGLPKSAVAEAVKTGAGKVARVAGGVGGENAAKWITFRGSDGSTYEGHPEDWAEIQKADPGAKEIK
jgi:hypothetical protein